MKTSLRNAIRSAALGVPRGLHRASHQRSLAGMFLAVVTFIAYGPPARAETTVTVGNPLVARYLPSDDPSTVLAVGAAAVLPEGTLNGVKTFNQPGSAGRTFNAYVLRPTGVAGQYRVVFDSGPRVVPTLPAGSTGQVETFAVGPFAVLAGDVFAHYGRGVPLDLNVTTSDAVYYPSPAAPALGSTIALPGAGFPAFQSPRNYSIAATVILPAHVFDSDTGETMEIQFASTVAAALAAKAAELGSPVAIYEYVSNSSEFTLYHGARSGSVNSFMGARGNDVDLAATLIAMLRSRGIPARYAVGTARMASTAVASWLGVKNVELAYHLLRDQGIQRVALAADKTTIDLEHVWVEALIPYAYYRGAGGNVGNCAATQIACNWVSLDPSFQQRLTRASGLDPASSVSFDYAAYYDAIKNNDPKRRDKNPLEIYEDQLLEWLQANAPGKTLEDVPDVLGIVRREAGLLPASLPFTVIGPVRRYNSIADHDAAVPAQEPEKWTQYVWVTATPDVPRDAPFVVSAYVPLVRLATERLTVTTEITAGVPAVVVRLGGAEIARPIRPGAISGYTPAMNDPFTLTVAMDHSPAPGPGGADFVIEHTHDAMIGGYYLVAAGGETSNWSQVHSAARRLLDANTLYPVVFKPGEPGCLPDGTKCTPYVDLTGNGWDTGDPRLSEHPAALDALTGGLLEVAQTQYCAKMRDGVARADALNKLKTPIAGFVGVLSTTQSVEYIDETAFSVQPGGLLIDIKFNVDGSWRIDQPESHSDPHFKLLSHIGSSLEHEIWQELTGYDAISTVRGIQIAVANGVALQTLTRRTSTDVGIVFADYGFGPAWPSPFALSERVFAGTKPATWSHPTHDYNQAFEMLKPTLSGVDPRRSSLGYFNGYHHDNVGCFIEMDSVLRSYPSTATVSSAGSLCLSDYAAGTTFSALINLNLSDYRTFQSDVVGQARFDYLDEYKGFQPSAMVYRLDDPTSNEHPAAVIAAMREAMWFQDLADGTTVVRDLSRSWVEHVLPRKLSVGRGFRFSVGITTTRDTASGEMTKSSYWIFNESIAANGGYVTADETLSVFDPDPITGGFDNATFTDLNTIGETNNDRTRTPSTDDPVSTVTGNNFHDETDLVIKGRGVNYVFTRTYNSASSSTKKDGPLGHGWTHSYAMKLASNDYGNCPNCSGLSNPVTVGNRLVKRSSYASDGVSNILVVGAAAALPEGTLSAFKTFNQPGSAGLSFHAYVLRPTGVAGQYRVVFDSGPLVVPALPPGSTGQIETFAVGPFAVLAGDVFAHYGRGVPFDLDAAATIPSDTIYYPSPAAPLLGNTIALPGTAFPRYPTTRNYSIAATVVSAASFTVGNRLVKRSSYASDGVSNILVVGAAAALPEGTLSAFKTFNQPGSAGLSFHAYVLRPTGAAGQYRVIFDSGPLVIPALPSGSTGQIETFAVGPFTVLAGDVFAHYGRGVPFDLDAAATIPSDTVCYPSVAAPLLGNTIAIPGTAFPRYPTTRNYSIAATVTGPAQQRAENGNGKTSSITYTDERGGEHNYLVDETTQAVTPPQGEFDVLTFDTPAAGQHTITFRNGVKYVFEGSSAIKATPGVTARLKQIADPWGNQLNFAYDGSGRLSTVSDNLGISGRSGLTLTYDGSGYLATVSDWTNRNRGYGVSNGDLVSYTNPLSQVTRYTYAPGTHNLFEIVKPLRRNGQDVKTAFKYYQNGRAFNYANALGDTETLDYDLFRRTTRVTDPRGGIREYQYDGSGRLTKLVEPDGGVLRFDNTTVDGLRFKKSDGLGYRTQYSYRNDRTFGGASDTGGNVTREQDPLSQTVDMTYGPYDQVATVKDKRGTVRTTTFHSTTDASCAVSGKPDTVSVSALSGVSNVPLASFCWNSNGTLESETEYIEPVSTTHYRRKSLIYDAAGLTVLDAVLMGEDGTSVTRKFTYDSLGRMKTNTLSRRASPTDPTLMSLTTTYHYDALDRVRLVEDAVGNQLETVYDANGQVEHVLGHYKQPDGSFVIRTLATRIYDAADRMIEAQDVYGKSTRYAYDASGNVIAVTDPNNHVTRYEYDAMNRRTAVIDANGNRTEITYDLAGRAVAIANANGGVVKSEHDALGRLTKVTDAKGFITQYVYDPNGNLTCTIDANAQAGLQPKNAHGCTEYRVYDELNRPVLVEDARNGQTVMAYDLLGKVTSVRDAENKTTTFNYDGLGRLAWTKDPLGYYTFFYPDEAGNAYEVRNRLNQVTRITYDLLNRPTRYDYLTDGTAETITYDPYGNRQTVSNGTVTYTFEYDLKKRLKRKIDSRSNRAIAFGYDDAGNLTAKTDYQGDFTTFQYDSTNRLVAMSNKAYLSARYQYDPAGRLLTRNLSNGARSEYGWDANGWLSSLRMLTANGTVLSTATYTRDRAGNIATVTDGAGTTVYTYDALYRLENADYPSPEQDESFTYDKVGNRLMHNDGVAHHYEYFPNSNRLWRVHTGSITGPVEKSFSHDDEGRLTAQAGGSGAYPAVITWDQKSRATSMTSSIGPTTTCQYDPLDYRIGRSGGSLGARAYYLEAEHLEAEYAGTTLQSKFFRGISTDELVAGKTLAGGMLVPAIYHHDQLMSVTGLSTHDGQAQQTLRYGAFGNLKSSTGSSANRLRYTGRELDADTQLYYYRARYYDPSIGRFISEDPLGFEAGVNFYAYVNNNPIGSNDPSGKDARVTVNGTKVDIQIRIAYSGEAANDATIDALNARIASQWSGAFGKYQVTTTVAPGHWTDVTTNRVQLVNGEDRSYVFAGRDAGTWFQPGQGNPAWEAGHEAGHLLGLDDQYSNYIVNGKTVTYANPGFETNVMGTYAQTGVREEDISAVIDANTPWYTHAWNAITSGEGDFPSGIAELPYYPSALNNEGLANAYKK